MAFQDRMDFARIVRRLGGRDVMNGVQVLLVALLAFLAARLVWAAIAPIGPIGTLPPPPSANKAAADPSVFSRFDPFFQVLGGSGPVVVSDLNLDLFGTRVDNVSGRGSAIMSADGGPQKSYFVGEDVQPGVKLHAVAFDSVTISRGGALEQLFLDQSIPARTVEAPPPAGDSAADAGEPVDVQRLTAEIAFEPVMVKGRIDGLGLKPAGDGILFTEIGLKQGDVLLSVNRARIDTKARAENIADLLGDARVAEFEIRRGAQVQTISFEIAR